MKIIERRVGLDILTLQRICHVLDRHGLKFVEKVAKGAELEVLTEAKPLEFPLLFAKLFSAKEAVFKVLSSRKSPDVWLRGLPFLFQEGKWSADIEGLKTICPGLANLKMDVHQEGSAIAAIAVGEFVE